MDEFYGYVQRRIWEEGAQEPMKWDLNVTGGELVISRSGGFLGWSVVTRSGIGSRSGPARITTHFPEGTGSHRLATGSTEQRYDVLLDYLIRSDVGVVESSLPSLL
jgi:hypothetical protein